MKSKNYSLSEEHKAVALENATKLLEDLESSIGFVADDREQKIKAYAEILGRSIAESLEEPHNQ